MDASKLEGFECQDIEFSLSKYAKEFGVKSGLPTNGIVLLPLDKGGNGKSCLFMSETYNLLKWVKYKSGIKQNISVLEVEKQYVTEFRSSEVWFPLVYLFSDVSLPLYLGVVANYLYDRMKGTLIFDKPNVKVEVIVEKKPNKTYKKFFFEGSGEELINIVNNTDIAKITEND